MLTNSVQFFGRNFAEFKFDQNIDGILELGLHGAKQKFHPNLQPL